MKIRPRELTEDEIKMFDEKAMNRSSEEYVSVKKIDTSWIHEELKKPIKDDYKFLFITSVVVCGTYCHVRQHWLYAPTYEMLYKMYANEKNKEPDKQVILKEEIFKLLQDEETLSSYYSCGNLEHDLFDSVEELEKTFKDEGLEFSRKRIKTSLKNVKRHYFK